MKDNLSTYRARLALLILGIFICFIISVPPLPHNPVALFIATLVVLIIGFYARHYTGK